MHHRFNMIDNRFIINVGNRIVTNQELLKSIQKIKTSDE